MQCWIREGFDPGENLAFEEMVLRAGVADGAFWLWRDSPSVIIGRNQIPEKEVAPGVARELGIQVYRRNTGGGAVFHDEGVVNFSFVVASTQSVVELLDAVRRALGIEGTVSERNDVVCDGFKIVGTAQRLLGGRRLFHGSILYDANLAVLASVLTPDSAKLSLHGVDSVAARVANLKALARLKLSTGDFMQVLFKRIVFERNWKLMAPLQFGTVLIPILPCELKENGNG